MIGGFVPYEGFWVLVVFLNEAANGGLQFLGRAMHATSQLLVGECGKPSLDQVEPTGRSRRKVQVKARPFHRPIANQLGFVRAVVIQDQMYVQLWRHVSFNRIGKLRNSTERWRR